MELNEAQKRALATLPGTPAWQALLDLFESEIEIVADDHLRCYKNKEEFERSGLIAVAMKLFGGHIETVVEMLGGQVLENKEVEKLQKQSKQFTQFKTFREVAEAIQQ